MAQCEGTTQKGYQCGNLASPGSIYCHLHGGRGGGRSGGRSEMSAGGGLGVLIAIVILVIWGCNKLQNLTLEDLGLSGGSSGRASRGFSSPAPAPAPARGTVSSPADEEPAKEPLEMADVVPELSAEERIAQNASAVAAFATAARLADDVFARDGSYAAAGPDALNEIAVSQGESLPVNFTDAVSNSPSIVSVSAPTAPEGSWGLAVLVTFGMPRDVQAPPAGHLSGRARPRLCRLVRGQLGPRRLRPPTLVGRRPNRSPESGVDVSARRRRPGRTVHTRR